VSAAIVGALLTAIYVIFTIVNAPTEDPDAVLFPSGYVAVSSDVGVRGDVLRWDSRGTTVFISSVVRTGVDPDTVAPVEVASWKVTSAGGEAAMIRQSMSVATPGALTVELGPIPDADALTLTATLPGAQGDQIEVPIGSIVGP
jgi:hypothetical protein